MRLLAIGTKLWNVRVPGILATESNFFSSDRATLSYCWVVQLRKIIFDSFLIAQSNSCLAVVIWLVNVLWRLGFCRIAFKGTSDTVARAFFMGCYEEMPFLIETMTLLVLAQLVKILLVLILPSSAIEKKNYFIYGVESFFQEFKELLMKLIHVGMFQALCDYYEALVCRSSFSAL